MQADEIIQQKEWYELSAGEKAIVRELADTEQEYNLIRKMLQVSSEEADEVPLISNSVKDELRMTVAGRTRSYLRYWLSAAAVIVVLLIASIFFKKENARHNDLVKKDPVSDTLAKPLVTPVIVPKIDTQAIVIAPVSGKQHDKITPVKPFQKLQKDDLSTTPDKPVYASVNKTIADEKELLDLVTEIY